MNSDSMRSGREDTPRPKDPYAKKPLRWFVGKNVLAAIEPESSSEQWKPSWVRIKGIINGALTGIRMADPDDASSLMSGDTVRVDRDRIEVVMWPHWLWRKVVDRLRARSDYSNRWFGWPRGRNFERAFYLGLDPKEALVRWRDWQRSDELPFRSTGW